MVRKSLVKPTSSAVGAPRAARSLVAAVQREFKAATAAAERADDLGAKFGQFPKLLGGVEGRVGALRRLATLPSAEILGADREILRAAVWMPASEQVVRQVVAVMLEAIPAAATGANSTYADALVHTILTFRVEHPPRFKGPSGPVLWLAAKRIWATATFTPSIAEVVAAVETEVIKTYNRFAKVNAAWNARADAERLIEQTEEESQRLAAAGEIGF